MTPDIISATYAGDYKIHLRFKDGKSGIVDFAGYLEVGGVFEKFKDQVFFRSFRIHPELGVLTWGDTVDISPETLYSQATRTALPEWMEHDPSREKTTNH